jgi:hypothetical protein
MVNKRNSDQRLSWEIAACLIDCKARNLSPGAVKRYGELLKEFAQPPVL